MQVSRCRWNLPQQTRWGGFCWWKGGFVLCVWNLLVVFMVNWCQLLVCLNLSLCKFHVLSQCREYVIGQLFNMWLHHNWSVYIYICISYMVICWCTRLARVAGWVSRDPHRGGTKITRCGCIRWLLQTKSILLATKEHQRNYWGPAPTPSSTFCYLCLMIY